MWKCEERISAEMPSSLSDQGSQLRGQSRKPLSVTSKSKVDLINHSILPIVQQWPNGIRYAMAPKLESEKEGGCVFITSIIQKLVDRCGP
ncbi:hypothetical protein AVEN_54114-1 [Araneus ventricosus]|uniref:Uncharacterized protein n=1 Tax=Araneus ventricosus TaxID=182803 RepID=A0A4Y2BUU0_ARAVE|nr:hypothetical protein AVEN_54114-1 [Araneus ventricosus]